ncbi:hypothetical protein [Novipirellula caenicola]|uniref:Uncharacterized protein n=1 Tax=Novipirellula caenicola TaxID=1536901 RepID=A0ABP9VVI1_9BACT
MGYNLYITRRKYHFEEEGPSITIDEWRAFVDADPELSFSHRDEALTAIWNGKCEYPDPWFAYSEDYGSIETKNPDVPIVNKMIQMAARLDAKVQGDDGEIYKTPSETYFEDEDDLSTSTIRPWWRRLARLFQ